MNKLISPILSPCGSLLTRTKVTVQRRRRTSEWHEATGESKDDKIDKLNSEHELAKTQLRLLRDRLREKNTVTSFRGILVEKSLSKRVDNLQKDLESEVKAQSENKPWWGYKRARPGHSKHSHWQFSFPRRTCYRPESHKFVGSACPICRDHWYPMYTDVEKIKKYVDPSTNKLPQRKFNWSTSDVYGRDRTEIYGNREIYHKSYRHLPGNVHYQPDNEHWGHVPVTTTSVQHDVINYE
ncbi:hypothetical protein ACHWQZ_G019392 [Mnemiopsis leidyi]